ncbi:NADH-quinone oxidoreductase subunit J [Azospirillaceae bacterium]
MIIQTFVFYLLSAILIASGLKVVTSRNPVHSVLFLILAFFQAAGLFVLVGAEFLAMLLVIVYVGAVAVLFLFVVMMLNIDTKELKSGFHEYLPIGLIVGGVLVVELIVGISSWHFLPTAQKMLGAPLVAASGVSNTVALGRLLYTQYAYLFQACGLVLLVSMLGAIVLTLLHKSGGKRQVISRQVGRRREDAVYKCAELSTEEVV